MRSPNHPWQWPSSGRDCCRDWQPLFIRENLLSLGHAAWQGWLSQGRGLVTCHVPLHPDTSVDWHQTIVPHTTDYVAITAVTAYLQAVSVEANAIPAIIDAVQSYQPHRDVPLLLRGQGPIEIYLLQNLAIAPPDCYRQVGDRWDEFAVSS